MGSPATNGFSLASVGRSALILTVATAATQLIGFAREVYVAAQVGVSADLDALIIGVALPTMLSGVFAAGATTALVPSYLEARKTGGSYHARRVAGSILALSIAGGFAITALLYVAAAPIVALTGPGLDTAGRDSAAFYLRLVAPGALFAGVASVLFAVLQAERRFRAIGISSVAGPLVTLVFMLLTWDDLGLQSLAVGTLIGQAAIPALMLAAMLRYGITPVPTVSLTWAGSARVRAPCVAALGGRHDPAAQRHLRSRHRLHRRERRRGRPPLR